MRPLSGRMKPREESVKMARLTDRQWEQARAEYEVRGISLGEVAKSFGVATSSVSRKAKAEG